MPEAKQIVYTHKELTELMLRDRGIRSGHWAIYITFRLAGVNVDLGGGDARPAAIAVVDGIGLQQADEGFPLSVDASKLAPKGTRRSRRGPKATVSE